MVSSPPPFLWLGEQRALDFLNTEPVVRGERVELLSSFERLVAWCEQAGLISRAAAREARGRWGTQADGERALVAARALRGDLRQSVERRATGQRPRPASLGSLNECLRRAGAHTEVVRSGSGLERRLQLTLTEPMQLLRPIADAAVELLCDIEPGRVRRCDNPECVLYFHDVSKNHARRWCSMALCGNRMKVAAHYERRRAGQSVRARKA